MEKTLAELTADGKLVNPRDKARLPDAGVAAAGGDLEPVLADASAGRTHTLDDVARAYAVQPPTPEEVERLLTAAPR